MFCESWRETLSAAAVSGEALPREAQAHLAACGSCRAALADQQRLSARVQSGLRLIANAETPVSLLPRVRIRVAEAPLARTWQTPVVAVAITAMALIAAITFSILHVSRSKEPSATASVPAPLESPAGPPSVQPRRAADPSATRQSKKESNPKPKATPGPGPYIIVEAGEPASLQTYLSAFRARARNNPALVTVKIEPAAGIKPLEIPEIEMPQLSIEQLQRGESK